MNRIRLSKTFGVTKIGVTHYSMPRRRGDFVFLRNTTNISNLHSFGSDCYQGGRMSFSPPKKRLRRSFQKNIILGAWNDRILVSSFRRQCSMGISFTYIGQGAMLEEKNRNGLRDG